MLRYIISAFDESKWSCQLLRVVLSSHAEPLRKGLTVIPDQGSDWAGSPALLLLLCQQQWHFFTAASSPYGFFLPLFVFKTLDGYKNLGAFGGAGGRSKLSFQGLWQELLLIPIGLIAFPPSADPIFLLTPSAITHSFTEPKYWEYFPNCRNKPCK